MILPFAIRTTFLTTILFFAFSASLSAWQERDPKADALADQVMKAMGGLENWQQTRYLTWDFFGRRVHVWDKHRGDIRVDNKEGLVVIMNVHTKEGKAWQNGEPIDDETELQKKLDGAYAQWINDAYWLVMPYKLKDPGVILRYAREDTLPDGRPADVLTLTFDNVGLTPQNKYEVYIGKDTHLVEQWAFFPKVEDTEPRIVTPWANWQPMGKIMLSGDRGQYQLTGIAVYDQLPVPAFSGPEPLNLSN